METRMKIRFQRYRLYLGRPRFLSVFFWEVVIMILSARRNGWSANHRSAARRASGLTGELFCFQFFQGFPCNLDTFFQVPLIGFSRRCRPFFRRDQHPFLGVSLHNPSGIHEMNIPDPVPGTYIGISAARIDFAVKASPACD